MPPCRCLGGPAWRCLGTSPSRCLGASPWPCCFDRGGRCPCWGGWPCACRSACRCLRSAGSCCLDPGSRGACDAPSCSPGALLRCCCCCCFLGCACRRLGCGPSSCCGGWLCDGAGCAAGAAALLGLPPGRGRPGVRLSLSCCAGLSCFTADTSSALYSRASSCSSVVRGGKGACRRWLQGWGGQQAQPHAASSGCGAAHPANALTCPTTHLQRLLLRLD